MTTPQVRAGTKTVTRRLGWWNLKSGELLSAIEKGQGLKKGEHVVRIRLIRVVSARKEQLDAITQQECVREGYPDYAPPAFIEMFCRANRCWPHGLFVNRIEFEYV